MAPEEMTYILDVIKDQVAGLANTVYKAQKDGNISWFEGIQIATRGTTAASVMMEAFKQLSDSDFEEFIYVLENSDLTLG